MTAPPRPGRASRTDAATGAYTVRLTVTAADGGSSSTSRAVQAAPTSGTSSSAAQTFQIAAGGGATLNTTAVTRAYFSLPGVPPGANVTVQSVTGNDRRATRTSHDFYIRQGATLRSIVTDNSAPYDTNNSVYPLTPIPPFGLSAVACTNGTVELDFDYGDPAYLPSTRPALDLLDIVLHVSWSTP